ncbi:PilZ domain-containing protein [Anaeromyxobacter paludicola]|uniref:PilZ domain-containing protein n=1 Tax=Anaeromyxobacter paludicola TaxID=2918171 RepID=A0ABN6N950_9BACT|nr:PilZ domain-containing protein [Anaeromyxobacter paludicola]BDG09774.1 hypothetical protein AMPC_28870 [Anaeromyxobacter paludicola]
MLAPRVSRRSFEEKNRLVLDGLRPLDAADLRVWEQGRDWLAARALADETGAVKRRHPRARVTVQAHLAGYGGAFTDDLGFGGVALRTHRKPPLKRGDEAFVRLKLSGRSVYVSGEVSWTDATRLGISIRGIHPGDERLLQALVCEKLLHRWEGLN